MADVELESPPALPEKPWWQSNSMWAAIVAFVGGVLASSGKFTDVAQFLNTNKDDLVGWVMQGVGLYMAFATLRRNSKVTIGK